MVSALVNLLSGADGEIAVIGDGRNDIAMFSAVRFSIAMGNAERRGQSKCRAGH